MQIVLIQSEIETAITNYVHSILSIAEGMEIRVDLSATRGAEGFKASIDIVPAGSEVVAPAPVVAPVVEKVVVPRTSRKVVEVVTPVVVVVADEAPVVVQAVLEVADEELAPDPVVVPVVADEQPAPVVPDEAPVAKPASLFSGLRRPNNG
jgi:hypothetical protein